VAAGIVNPRRQRLSRPELEQHVGTDRPRGRFLPGALQAAHGLLKRAPRQHPSGRYAQDGDYPAVGQPLGYEQMRRDPVGRRAVRVEQLGRVAVGAVELGGRQALVDRAPDGGMRELERPAAGEDPRGGERVGGPRRRTDAERGYGGGVPHLHAVAQHRD